MKIIAKVRYVDFQKRSHTVEKGTFPPKHKLSPQRVGFLKYQIEQWIEGKRKDWS